MEKGVKVDNVPIKELIALLANLGLYCDAVDLIVYPNERRVVINPVESEEGIKKEVEKNPNKVEIKGKDIDNII